MAKVSGNKNNTYVYNLTVYFTGIKETIMDVIEKSVPTGSFVNAIEFGSDFIGQVIAYIDLEVSEFSDADVKMIKTWLKGIDARLCEILRSKNGKLDSSFRAGGLLYSEYNADVVFSSDDECFDFIDVLNLPSSATLIGVEYYDCTVTVNFSGKAEEVEEWLKTVGAKSFQIKEI